MKKKLFALALLTTSASAFAAPISTPTNVSDTPIIGGNNGTCGTVDLTNATSDYMLKPCETAIIRFYNQTLVPLHVAVPEPSAPDQPVTYEITVTIYQASNTNMDTYFAPNNYLYPGQFRNVTYERTWDTTTWGPSGWSPFVTTTDRFYFDTYGGMTDTPPFLGIYRVVYYGANYPKQMANNAFSDLSVSLSTSIWEDTSTPWTSLGTFGIKYSLETTNWDTASGQIVIRRLS